MSALKTNALSYAYPGNEAIRFPDLAAEAGNTLLILGKSGAGKTTLLHLLAGLLQPERGTIHIKEQSLSALKGSELDRFRGTNIGLVFQKPVFVKGLSLLENLKLARFLAGKPQDSGPVLELLDQLGLADKGGRKPAGLSQGELQRASLCRALINQPALVLADEPTSALDDVNATKVADLLESRAREAGAALVIVTHDQRLKDRFTHRIEL